MAVFTIDPIHSDGTSRAVPVMIEKRRFFMGLDLGQSIDPSALAILEGFGENPNSKFHCLHLHRYPLGTSYPEIVKDVIRLCETSPLSAAENVLAIDGTGVGRAVVDLFLRATIKADCVPILIHGGDKEKAQDGWRRVPKRELVSTAQALLQTGRLKLAGKLPDLEVLKSELQNFQVRISDDGHDSYDARSGAHDDLVLAVSMALWTGTHLVRWECAG